MTEAQIIADIETFLTSIPSDVESALSIIAAWRSTDQAALDTLHAQALAAANAERPSGAPALA